MRGVFPLKRHRALEGENRALFSPSLFYSIKSALLKREGSFCFIQEDYESESYLSGKKN
jgi:hypothetical protein